MEITTKINVLFIASEADPLVKVGGLADVAGSLPPALKAISQSFAGKTSEIDIRLAIPYHPQMRTKQYAIHPLVEFPIKTIDEDLVAKVFMFEQAEFPIYLVGGAPIDQETGIYSADLEADGYKYVFFSLACLEMLKLLGWTPHILHANDWHTAAAVYSLALRRPIDPFFAHTASLITVHNLPYLGSMTTSALQSFNLPAAAHSGLPSWARQMALPLGLLAADAIVAVSPGYAKEILTE
jgi:starch synthase